jgi:hypothetical protein
MDRRSFLQSATLIATAAGAATSLTAAAPAATAETTSISEVKTVGAPAPRRWLEQRRWMIDNVIKTNGIDWDQPRSIYLNSPCGFDADGDFAAIRQRVQKCVDNSSAFEAGARLRESKGREAQDAQNPVSARDNLLVAAVLWAAAQWPIVEVNDKNMFYNRKKCECYEAYGNVADRRVETVCLPAGRSQANAGMSTRTAM